MKSLIPTSVILDDVKLYPANGRCANQKCHSMAKLLISVSAGNRDFDNVPLCRRCTVLLQKEHNKTVREAKRKQETGRQKETGDTVSILPDR